MLVQKSIPKTAQNPIVYLMKNYADFNLWANYKLVNWLDTKPEELLEKEVPSSYPSIKLTLLHIWQSEQYWYSFIRNTTPPARQEFDGSIEDIFENLVDQSSLFADFVNSLVGEDLLKKTEIVSPWFEANFPNFEYIMHCFNHSTYHRGQLITIGRNLGFTDAPMTDYNYYNIHGK